ncbi:hypothetical protein NC997_14980 [Trichocoleus sp. DQ-A2]|uniref:hypothetical protein n=1 Tax=Cyanophyceae TaxID=3028117 RepID=UPI0016878ECA|nr:MULTISPECIES: hypothetical protein [unclassified Coleofasciculus]MBD1836853.1 hypothetical protein [Coleofasciculus sp. FACHB-501]MBD1879670.1 hypothetical protein [Coleofasciculus sp. FACHB-T130]
MQLFLGSLGKGFQPVKQVESFKVRDLSSGAGTVSSHTKDIHAVNPGNHPICSGWW